MRNDLQDEPKSIPSLTVDDDEYVSDNEYIGTHKINQKQPTHAVYRSNRGFNIFFFILLLCCMAGGFFLFLLSKQTIDSLQHQLDEKVQHSSSLTQSTTEQLNKQLTALQKQQASSLESVASIRTQNKQFASRLLELATAQDKLIASQKEQELRITKLNESVMGLAKVNNKTAELKSLAQELELLKKRDLSPTVKSIQDDLLLLRSQIDNTDGKGSIEALEVRVNQQLQQLQDKVKAMQSRLDNISPY